MDAGKEPDAAGCPTEQGACRRLGGRVPERGAGAGMGSLARRRALLPIHVFTSQALIPERGCRFPQENPEYFRIPPHLFTQFSPAPSKAISYHLPIIF